MGKLNKSYVALIAGKYQLHIFLGKEFGELLELKKAFKQKASEYPTKPMPRAPNESDPSYPSYVQDRQAIKEYNKKIADIRKQLFNEYIAEINRISGMQLSHKNSISTTFSSFAQLAIVTDYSTMELIVLDLLEDAIKGRNLTQTTKLKLRTLKQFGLIQSPTQIPLWIQDKDFQCNIQDIYEVAIYRNKLGLDIFNEINLLKQFNNSEARQRVQILKVLNKSYEQKLRRIKHDTKTEN